MNHHIRSGIAIVLVLAFVGISWLLDHRPADWEYVFLMFVVFSSAMQDAMDDEKLRIGKATLLLEEAARKTEHLSREVQQQAKHLSREVQQQAEYLKCHITGEANLLKSDFALLKYELALAAALQRDEDAPEAPEFVPPYPEPKFVSPEFVPLESPKLEPFDAQKWREERVRVIATALGGHSWWDMSVVTIPFRRLVAYIVSRPGFIRRISR
ncbi:MAG TPA: hypothetical protein VGR03_09310 [Candidatus Acidoferrum sp.]|nr:hypothetical protein [Candidatus Acidoferrum sp.]